MCKIGCKKGIQLGKAFFRFLDFIDRKHFTLISKMTILINCTDKFCYKYGNFQNTKAATGSVLKKFRKFTGKHLRNFIKTETLTQMFCCTLCEIFKNTFLASDCFSNYESFYTIVVIHSFLMKSCSENIWKISKSLSASDYNFH